MQTEFSQTELDNIAEEIRKKRNLLIDEADTKYCNAEKWELMPEETKALWRIYKQALRDITKQEGFPLNVVFPQKPL